MIPTTSFRLRVVFITAMTMSYINVLKSRPADPPAEIVKELQTHQHDLSGNGKEFLLNEARRATFFLLGELHGEQEIPALLRELWPGIWQDGYRHIAAEISPWAAHRLETGPMRTPAIKGLWTTNEAAFARSFFTDGTQPVLWGCDMEEQQLSLLIQDLAQANPGHARLGRMAEMTRDGYDRSMAAVVVDQARSATGFQDRFINGTSLYTNILVTLEIDRDRQAVTSRHDARVRREDLMKELFIQQFDAVPGHARGKVLFRFGRNHLHRGLDARGVSTLGNFAAELAAARGFRVFNVAAFAGGGTIHLAGRTMEADERGDDLAFGYLAGLARFPATVFDLRPLRAWLHQIPSANRTPLQSRLIYWSDSYDAIIYYRQLTPLGN